MAGTIVDGTVLGGDADDGGSGEVGGKARVWCWERLDCVVQLVWERRENRLIICKACMK